MLFRSFSSFTKRNFPLLPLLLLIRFRFAQIYSRDASIMHIRFRSYSTNASLCVCVCVCRHDQKTIKSDSDTIYTQIHTHLNTYMFYDRTRWMIMAKDAATQRESEWEVSWR